MMARNLQISPPSPSSSLPSSLFLLANDAKPLFGRCLHPRLLHCRCHLTFSSCSFRGSFSQRSFLKRVHLADCGNGFRIIRYSSTVCESYGRDDAETSNQRYGLSREDSAPLRSYGTVESFKRGRMRSESLSPQRNFSRKSMPGKYFEGAEAFKRDFSASIDNRSSASFDRESPASGSHGRPRSFMRQFPARIDRLQEFVSHNRGSVHSHGRLSLLGDPSNGRATADSPFKNSMVSVLWDLDNKPPTTSPYEAALFLRHAASQFGSVVDMVAYANSHAFTYVPEWVREQRHDRKELDTLERKGIVQPDKPYVCQLCGRRCKTNFLLTKHFKQLHEREHNKRMTRLNSLKGKKREKYGVKVMPQTQRYKEAASPILVPKVGYGLESDLRRAGVFVKTVQFKPQAADIELKKQVANSIQKGIKCICLVSDDAGFSTTLADARALNLRTIVFGDSKSLKRYADFWFPWEDVLRGIPAEYFQEAIHGWALYHDVARQRDLKILGGLQKDDAEVEHGIFGGSTPVLKPGFSAFSEEEPLLEDVEYGSVSDMDDTHWSFEDEDGEIDDEWEADADDSELG